MDKRTLLDDIEKLESDVQDLRKRYLAASPAYRQLMKRAAELKKETLVRLKAKVRIMEEQVDQGELL